MARQVVVDIVGDSKKYTKATDEAVKASQSFADKLKGVGGDIKKGFLEGIGIGGGLGVYDAVVKTVGAVVGQVGHALDLASDKAEAASKANVLFGSSYDIIERASKTAATAVGLSSGAYIAAAGDVGNLITNLGFAGDEAASMSKDIVQLSADMGSFNNADTAEVVDAIGAAFRGETEPIRRFGVMLSAAKVEAKALAMGLKDGKKPLTDNAKAMATYQLILEQTTAAQGDFARTSDGKANADRIRAAKAEEAWTRLGEVLTPLYQKVMPLIAEATTTAIDTITNLANIAAPLVDGALQGIAGAIDTIGDSFAALKALMDPTGTEAERVTRAIMDQAKALGLDGDAAVLYIDKLKAQRAAELELQRTRKGVLEQNIIIARTIGSAYEEIDKYRQAIKEGGDAEALNNIIMERKQQLLTQLTPYLTERDRLLGIQRGLQEDVNEVDNESVRINGLASQALADYNKHLEDVRATQQAAAIIYGQTSSAVEAQTSSFSRAASELNLGYGSVLLATVESQKKAAVVLAPENPKGVAKAVENTIDDMFMTMADAKEPWKAQWKELAAWAKDPFKPEKFEDWVAGRVKAAMKKARETFGGERQRWLKIAAAYRWIAKNNWIDPMKADIGLIMTALKTASLATDAAKGKKGRGGSGGTAGRASGGPVSAGSTYLVGERGPELVTMGGNGFVTPNHALGGSTYNISVHVAPGGDMVEAGRQMVQAIRAYERRSGAVWRS